MQLGAPGADAGCTYSVRPNGTFRSQLTFCDHGESDPAWSPNGNRLAFHDIQGIGFWDVEGWTQLIYDGGGVDGLGWSPDGLRVVAANDPVEDCGPNPDPNYCPAQLYTTRADYPGDFRLLAERRDGFTYSHPAWSPDGTKIVFETGGVLYTIRPDGTGLTPLPVLGFHPTWSPDGTEIAYDSGDSVFVANADGTGPTPVATSPGLDIEPAWSPDGKRIAFASSRNDPTCGSTPGSCSFDIYAVNVDGTSPTRLTSDPTSERTPDWQPVINYVRPKGASPSMFSLVPAFKACTAPDSTHGAPLSSGSCTRPDQASSFLTVGTPDANGQPANALGFIRFRAESSPTTADMLIDTSITDVRNKNDLSDYSGLLQAVVPLRITDKSNYSQYNAAVRYNAATVSDTDFPIAIPCRETASASVGSTCAISTSANAIMPYVVPVGGREVWEMGQVKVYDGGSGGYDGAPDATLFMNQGVFIP